MTLIDLAATLHIPYYQMESFLRDNKIPFVSPFFGDAYVDDTNVSKIIAFYYEKNPDKLVAEEEAAARAAREAEEAARIAAEEAAEAARKKKAMAQMLITSGFNFDGYRVVKYSGYISGDDAMTVSRGSSFTDGGVRDKLMASLVEIRRNALRELKEAAYDLGCNAIIGVDFDYITLDPQTANLSGGTTYQPYVFGVTANGNAVIIEKIED